MSRTLADMTPTELGGSMTDHADTLRGMARGPHPGLSHSATLTLTAGADALDTLDKVRVAMEHIDRLGDAAWAEWKRTSDMHAQGEHDAYDLAHTLITDALGDAE